MTTPGFASTWWAFHGKAAKKTDFTRHPPDPQGSLKSNYRDWAPTRRVSNLSHGDVSEASLFVSVSRCALELLVISNQILLAIWGLRKGWQNMACSQLKVG